jgi:hypothetical protein
MLNAIVLTVAAPKFKNKLGQFLPGKLPPISTTIFNEVIPKLLRSVKTDPFR